MLTKSKNKKMDIEKVHRQDGDLKKMIPYYALIDDKTIVNKDGTLLSVIAMDGINADCLDTANVTNFMDTLTSAMRSMNYLIGYHVTKMTMKAPEIKPMMDSSLKEYAIDLEDKWVEYLNEQKLNIQKYYITIYLKPALKKMPIVGTRIKEMIGDNLQDRRKLLRDAVVRINEVCKNYGSEVLTAESGKLLGFLRASVGLPYQDVRANDVGLLSNLFTDYEVHFGSWYAEIITAKETRYAAIIYLSAYPLEVLSLTTSRLSFRFPIIVSNSWTPMPQDTASNVVEQQRRRLNSLGGQGATDIRGLSEAADKISSGLDILGKHQFNVMVIGNTLEELERNIGQVHNALGSEKLVSARENSTIKPTFFSFYPSNTTKRYRLAAITTEQFARFMLPRNQSKGLASEKVTWGKTITSFRTFDHTKYDFNFHLQGSEMGSPSTGHTLVIGPTGSGKTVFVNFLMTQSIRVNPRIIVFDKDFGMESLIRALGGEYNLLKYGKATGLNPILSESDEDSRAWLEDWIMSTVLKDITIDGKQSQAITRAIVENNSAPEKLRTFDHFSTLLTDSDAEGNITAEVEKWGSKGKYSWLFGQEGKGQLFDIQNQITAFDMSEILQHPTERTALLSYLFRVLDKKFSDGQPTLLVIDEAWQVFDDEFFAKRLRDWLVTLRKKNVAVVMLTQMPQQLTTSSVGDIVLRSTQTKVLFPNMLSKRGDYRNFNIGNNVVNWIVTNRTDARSAYVMSGKEEAFIDVDMSVLGNLFPVLAGGVACDNAYGSDWMNRVNFWKQGE